MTVRYLFGVAALATLASLLAATDASAQIIRYSAVTNPPTGGVFTGTNGAKVTSIDATNVLGDLSTPTALTFANLRNDSTGALGANGSFNTNYSILLSITDQNNGQTLSNTLTGNLTASSLDQTGGSFFNTFNTSSLTYNFANGDVLLLNSFSFLAPGANPALSQTGGTLGGFGANARFTTPSAAPEPGSLALAATGLLGTLGMVGVRRRRGSLAA